MDQTTHIHVVQRVVQLSPQGMRKPTVVDHFMPADVSSVKQESNILKDCKIHFINYGSHSKQDMEALVRKLGGTVRDCCINYSVDSHVIYVMTKSQYAAAMLLDVAASLSSPEIMMALVQAPHQGRPLPCSPVPYLSPLHPC